MGLWVHIDAAGGTTTQSKIFEKKYLKKITIITSYHISFNMSVVILDLFDDNMIPEGLGTFVSYCCAVAHFVIARNWKLTNPLQISNWIDKLV